MKNIILASQSPRRKDLLTAMGLEFSVKPSNFEENLDHSRSAQEVSIELGLGKVMAVAKDHPDAIVIGGDTIVSLDGKQYGKAESPEEEFALLKLLAGKEHTVTSSLVIVCLNEGLQYATSSATKVIFKPFNKTDVDAYVALNEWPDKAVYSIQAGHKLIDHIVGRYDVVIGLPTNLLAAKLKELGIKAKAVEPPCPVPVRSQ